jgi:predicted transposase/invertase (TIGR01784 family)
VRALCNYVPEIQEAKKMFDKAKADPKVRELIFTREKAIRDYTNDIACAKDEGVAIGEEKGKKETALKLLSRNMSVGDISEITGLLQKDILELQPRKK